MPPVAIGKWTSLDITFSGTFPCSIVYQHYIPFHGWIIFCCVDRPHFIYLSPVTMFKWVLHSVYEHQRLLCGHLLFYYSLQLHLHFSFPFLSLRSGLAGCGASEGLPHCFLTCRAQHPLSHSSPMIVLCLLGHDHPSWRGAVSHFLTSRPTLHLLSWRLLSVRGPFWFLSASLIVH